MALDNENAFKLNFGVNTDSFFGIGFGLIGNNDIAALKAEFGEFFNLLNSYGIRTIEINTEIEQLHPGSLRDLIIPLINSFQPVDAPAATGMDFSVTVHLPYLQLNPASPLEEYRKFSANAVVNIIKAVRACEGLPVKKFVIHLTSEFEDSILFFPVGEETKKALIETASAQARKSMSEILAGTGLDPQAFAIENLEVFPFEYLYPIAEELGVSVCFDMGHWGLNGFMPEDFLKRFGLGHIGEINIQDMAEKRTDMRTTVRNEHRPLGTGILNTAGFFNYLAGKKCAGPLIIENRSKEDLITSLEYLKSGGFL